MKTTPMHTAMPTAAPTTGAMSGDATESDDGVEAGGAAAYVKATEDTVGLGAVGLAETYKAAVAGIPAVVPTAAVSVALDIATTLVATDGASASSAVTAKSTTSDPRVSFWIETRLFDTLSIAAMSVATASARRA